MYILLTHENYQQCCFIANLSILLRAYILHKMLGKRATHDTMNRKKNRTLVV